MILLKFDIRKREYIMNINQITVSGFRNVKKCTLNFDELISLVSTNNYGKSNSLGGIDFGIDFIKASEIGKKNMMAWVKGIPLNKELASENYKINLELSTEIKLTTPSVTTKNPTGIILIPVEVPIFTFLPFGKTPPPEIIPTLTFVIGITEFLSLSLILLPITVLPSIISLICVKVVFIILFTSFSLSCIHPPFIKAYNYCKQ